MACEHSSLTKRKQRCPKKAVRRGCGHAVCDGHRPDHAALCQAKAQPVRALTERDRMNLMSLALGCPSPYGDF